jgi:PIN domain
MTVAIFIDTNQYLKLFQMSKPEKLLDALQEQKKYIFVPRQIVDEVMRNKLKYAKDFFKRDIGEIEKIKADVPELDRKVAKFKSILRVPTDTNKDIRELAAKTLSSISQSEDDVSKRLMALFEGANPPTSEEMQRARDRREKGNPPGKASDTLGDQIVWEQLLPYCKREGIKRLWIASDDGDYVTKFYGRSWLNPFLAEELQGACGPLEIRSFDDAMEAIQDFGRNAKVPADQLPSDEEAKEIVEERRSLPPFIQASLNNWNDAAVQIAASQRALRAAISGYSAPPFPPPGPSTPRD